MINKYKKVLNSSVLVVLLSILCFSCDTDLYETFDEYVDPNQGVVSVASAQGFLPIPGYEKLLLKIAVNADPKIDKAVVEWFERVTITDKDTIVMKTAILDIDRTEFVDEIYDIEFEIPEGQYDMDVYLEDAFGTQSNSFELSVTIPGEEYRESLTSRTYISMSPDSDTSVAITWDALLEGTSVLYSTLRYVDSSGTEQIITIANDDTSTVISDVVSESTFYIKSTHAIAPDFYPLYSEETLESDETEYTFIELVQ